MPASASPATASTEAPSTEDGAAPSREATAAAGISRAANRTARATRLATAEESAPPLAETAYLVDAVAASQPPRPMPAERDVGPVADRVIWVARLFAELEARDRLSGRRA